MRGVGRGRGRAASARRVRPPASPPPLTPPPSPPRRLLACDRTVGAALGLVAAERAGQAVARDVLQSAVRMLRMLGLYGPRFEDRLLDEARVFYTADGNTAAGTFDVCAFLTHAEQRLAQANEAVDAYLDAATRRPLVALVEAHLIAPHAEAYLDSGLRSLADDGRVADVRRLHLLLARVALTPKVAAAFGAYAQARATAITTDTDPAHEKGTVAALLDCRRRLDTILCGAFESKEAFAQALKTAFENALNGRGNRPAELLAKHVDAQLRSGAGKDGMDAETSIGVAMKLFSYLHAKDVFEAFYKKDLAKRLLLGKSASLDLEKAVIGKLRAECGGNYTKHLEGMFKDVDLGKELMAQYAASRGAAAGGVNNDTEMVVQVLTQGFWPSYPEMASLIVPPALAAHQAHFNEYYSKKYQGRRIAWQHALGHCIVKARFNGCTKELDVSTYQTLVLVCVGSRGGGGDAPVAFAEIKAATGIEDGELRRTLQSLACAKVKVLRKEPKSRDVNDGDTFAVRVDFKHERIRIKINSIQLRETAEENAKTHANVVRDRECHVDAAVVRIMKARKRLTHNELIAETMKQLRHPATPADLKKRIGTLIEREYVCRDEDEPGVYNYMA